MSTIHRHLSTLVDGNGRAQILLRVNVARGIQIRVKSGLYISPEHFINGGILIPHPGAPGYSRVVRLARTLHRLETDIIDHCEANHPLTVAKPQLLAIIHRHLHPELAAAAANTCDFSSALDDFLADRKLSAARTRSYRVMERILQRFATHIAATTDPTFTLHLSRLTPAILSQLEAFLIADPGQPSPAAKAATNQPPSPRGCAARPKRPQTTTRPQRGENTIASIFNRLKAFLRWCTRTRRIPQNPFDTFSPRSVEKYGTPYYITIPERNTIADHDLTAHPDLIPQRDIFIFQCLTGCRVSDLTALTGANIIGDAIEYIPRKTKHTSTRLIRVPLHPRAQKLIQAYRQADPTQPIFPFTSNARYNQDIRRIFTICGITRPVTVLDPKTREDKVKPINQVASSHIARRTFIGNLYSKVQDPNLISALSGHTEGSHSFARYRAIDDTLMRQIIALLDD